MKSHNMVNESKGGIHGKKITSFPKILSDVYGLSLWSFMELIELYLEGWE